MSKKVFIVEDDAAYAGELRMAFESAGFTAELFETANAALKAFAGSKPALMVTGAMLEDLGSGFRLANQVKADAPELPVVMVTGIDELTGLDFESRAAEGEFKIDAYIKKPADAAEVAEIAKGLPA